MTKKLANSKKLLWLDMEMTGLSPAEDRIVEVAAIVTDWDFNELASFESGIHHADALLRRRFKASGWAAEQPGQAAAMLELSAKSPGEQEVEVQLIEFASAHFDGQQAVLAGNSIHQDRQFIRRWMPDFEECLHYRMLDVSAWKVVMIGKYGVEFKKQEKHRALDDIRESIAELKFYLQKAEL